jgi:hypothetical protein
MRSKPKSQENVPANNSRPEVSPRHECMLNQVHASLNRREVRQRRRERDKARHQSESVRGAAKNRPKILSELEIAAVEQIEATIM